MGNDGKLNPHSSAAFKEGLLSHCQNIQKFCHFATKKRVKRVWDELKLAGTVATHWNALDACKEVVVAGCDIRV